MHSLQRKTSMNNPYTILPFQFKRVDNNNLLLVNEAGDFLYLTENDFNDFIQYKLPVASPIFYELKSHLLLVSENTDLAVKKTGLRLRSRKAFLRDFTILHMMVITLRCNQHCDYCQVSCAEENAKNFDMSVETAKKIIESIFRAPTDSPKIEFQGGEPLLNWNVITASVLYAEELAKQTNKKVEFVICTNLTAITEDKLYFCKEHCISISTSLDGPKFLHDACRKKINGAGTYDSFIKKLELTRSILGEGSVNALMTTSVKNLDNMNSVIDEYIRLGFKGIFLRSLNPYGFAAEKKKELGYDIEKFVEKYFEALTYLIEINKKVYFQEYFTSLLLARILTPFSTGFVDLQSPAGAGISGVIYDYDGSVFPADEARMLARMGDRHFCLGNVYTETYDSIFLGDKLKNIINQSCVETSIPCAWCAYQNYCGCDPIRNYLESGRESRNMVDSPFCRKYSKTIEGLLKLIKNADEQTMNILWSWITGNPDLVNRDA